jgi:hypothetical protein
MSAQVSAWQSSACVQWDVAEAYLGGYLAGEPTWDSVGDTAKVGTPIVGDSPDDHSSVTVNDFVEAGLVSLTKCSDGSGYKIVVPYSLRRYLARRKFDCPLSKVLGCMQSCVRWLVDCVDSQLHDGMTDDWQSWEGFGVAMVALRINGYCLLRQTVVPLLTFYRGMKLYYEERRGAIPPDAIPRELSREMLSVQ